MTPKSWNPKAGPRDPGRSWTVTRSKSRSRRPEIAIAIGGLGILVIAGFIAASLLGPLGNDPAPAAAAVTSPTAAPSMRTASMLASVSPQATSSAPSTPTQAPTPTPTPAGPPQAIAVDGWATVTVDELNVRREAGMRSTSAYSLVRGAIGRVFEGPVAKDGLDWYRIGSLSGAKGWVASGPQADPYLETFSEDNDLLHCGPVESDVVRMIDGSVQAVDPIRIGELALPAAAFSDMEVAILELVRATRAEACFSAEVIPVEVIAIYTQTSVGACGALTGDGDAFRLRPVAGSGVGIESQVKASAVLHPAMLAADPNIDTRIRLAAQGEAVTVCLSGGVTESATGVETNASIDGSQCAIVDEHAADHLTVRDVSGGDAYRFSIQPDQQIEAGSVAVGTPMQMGFSAGVYGAQHSFWVWQSEPCG